MLLSKADVAGTGEKFSSAAGAQTSEAECTYIFGRGYEVIKHLIGKVEQNRTIHYWTEGEWSAHELMEYLLEATGPAKVYLTTWAMSENPVRALLRLIEQKKITVLYAIFDVKCTDRAPKVFQLVNSITTKVKLSHCHAKVFVIENDEWLIANNGSANWTKNPRTESGVITTVRKDAAFYRDCIIKKINMSDDIE